MSLIINVGKLTATSADAYSNYQGGLDTPANKASFSAAIASLAAAIVETGGEANFLKGVGIGVAPAASVLQLSISIANLENAKTPADAMAAALGILSGSAGTLEALLPPCPLKLTLTAITIAASAAQLGVQSNTDAVNDLINDVVNQLQALPTELGGNGNSIGYGAPGGMSAFSAAAAEAATVAPRIDPLVLDLDGDGIETTSTRNGSVILFDHDGDGIKTGTGWVKPDDGWLVLDSNGNGVIDSGHELFGVNTLKSNSQLAKDGFDALNDLDDNLDNKINSIDEKFANLRIWRDLNQDGISQANELSTLSDNSIIAININSTAVRNDLGNGNIQTAAGSFTRSNGTTGITGETSENTAGNLDLLVSTFYRQFTTHIPLTDQAKSLPSLRGSGQVRDLNEAISLSTDLGETVAIYAQQTTRQDQINQLDRFIDQWANTSEMKSLKEQANTLENNGVKLNYQLAGLTVGSQAYENFIHKLGVVERFMGFTYAGANGQPRFTNLNTNSGNLTVSLAGSQIDNILLAYERFKTDIYESLLIQTRLKGYFEKLDISLKDSKAVLNFLPVEEAFKAAISLNPREGIIDLIEFLSAVGETRLQNLNWNATDFLVHHLKIAPDLGFFSEELSRGIIRFAAANEHNFIGSSRADLITATDSADTIRTDDGNDIVLGKGGDDVVDGGNGNDYIDGGEGNDTITDYYGFNTIKGGDGDDTIIGRGTIEGGKGDDVITASHSLSGDTYIFNLGDGKDTIIDYGFSNALGYDGNSLDDTLKFGVSIEASTVTLARNDNNLIFKINETDQVTIKDWFYNGVYQIETIQFADGSSWDIAKLKTMVPTTYSTTNADEKIYGWDGIDKILALGGNDIIYGYGNDDILDGGDGDDVIDGGGGNDQILGGEGNDTIIDYYGFNTIKGGDGNDSITAQGIIEGGKGNDIINSNNFRIGDTFIFNIGDGKDTISDYGASNVLGYAGTGLDDTLKFGEGIEASTITLTRSGNSLIFKINETDQVTIKDWFYSGFYQIEIIQFADGSSWDLEALRSMAIPFEGTDNDDILYGWNGKNAINGAAGSDIIYGGLLNDLIDGGTGNDRLYGYAGADTLFGGEGNDELYGHDGDDYLDGDKGNDYLDGGMGNDTYQFHLGSGNDGIWDNDYTTGNNDTVSFTDIASTDVTSIDRKRDNLVITYGKSDSLTLGYYFYSSSYRIEQIKFSDGVTWDEAAIKSRVMTRGDNNDNSIYGYNSGSNRIYGLGGDDYLVGGDRDDVIGGGTGNDRLYGYAGADKLFGDFGNDELYGYDGDDYLDGGEGNDYLDGGMGNDTYQFHLGSGNDGIWDNDYTTGNNDTVSFTDVASTDVTSIDRKRDNLVITYGKSDSLTLGYYFYSSSYRIEQIKFSDGVTWDEAAIKSRVMTRGDNNDNSIYGYNSGSNRIYGLGGDDYLVGGDRDDVIGGGTGNDRLYGYAGADKLFGDLGNDELYGYDGDDFLDGGEGTDYLDGGLGSDIYEFGLGSGLDRISDYDYQSGNNDVLSIGRGVEANQIWLRRVDNDLEVSIIGTGDKTTISNWYYGSTYHIEEFKTSDGKTLLNSQVDALVSAMAGFAPPKAGETTLPANYQSELNAVIAANWK